MEEAPSTPRCKNIHLKIFKDFKDLRSFTQISDSVEKDLTLSVLHKINAFITEAIYNIYKYLGADNNSAMKSG